MIRKLKLVLGCSLIIIGILYEVIVFVQLNNFVDSNITSSTSSKNQGGYSVEQLIEMAEGGYTVEQIPIHNYHHFLYGLGMIAGAIILGSVKESKVD